MWFLYALGFAFFSSINVLLAKKIMGKLDEYAYLLFSIFFIIPFVFLISIFKYGLPTLDSTFWVSISIGAIFAVCGAVLAYRAIRISEISLVSPISAFNPVFTGLISALLLREALSFKSWAGIVIIVIGVYVLQINKSKKDFLFPIKALVSHKGVRLYFFASFSWAISPIFEKTAIFHTNPQNSPFVIVVESLISAAIYLPIVASRSNLGFIMRGVKNNIVRFLMIGVLGALGSTLAFLAYSSGNLGPTTAVFRLNMVFMVLWGGLFFKEKNFRNRLLGSIVMLLGVVLLVS